MSKTFFQRCVSLALSVVFTVATLGSIHGLSATEAGTAQAELWAAQPSAQA